MFVVPEKDVPLTQGDVLDECPLVSLEGDGPLDDLQSLPIKQWMSRVVVLTQACDLVQMKSNVVLVAQIIEAQALVDRGVLKGVTIRDQVRRHQVFGWYFLPAATAPVPLPESIVDLRDIHSVPRVVLEELIARQTRGHSPFAVPRTPRPAFRRHLDACRATRAYETASS